MPELPEVETARRRAERVLCGRRIVAVAVARDPIVFQSVSPSRFAAALRGRLVLAVRRKGKHLWLELDRRPWPLFHFWKCLDAYRGRGPPEEGTMNTAVSFMDGYRGEVAAIRQVEAHMPRIACAFLRDLVLNRQLADAGDERAAGAYMALVEAFGSLLNAEAEYHASVLWARALRLRS